MAADKDRFSTLSDTVDIAGTWYYFGSTPMHDHIVKSRKAFQHEFDDTLETERLIRQYLFFSAQPSARYRFANKKDKEALLKRLQARLLTIKQNMEFSNKAVEYSLFASKYNKLQHLIEQIQPTKKGTTKKDPLQSTLKHVWTKLHPHESLEEIQSKWNKNEEEAKELRLFDLVQLTKSERPISSDPHQCRMMLNRNLTVSSPQEMKQDIRNVLTSIALKQYIANGK